MRAEHFGSSSEGMLVRLGQGLKAAVGEAGAAYRIGGDEFCVVVNGSAALVDAVTKRAAEGLTASNHGVEVSASWGAATVPDEAPNPSEAMRHSQTCVCTRRRSRAASPTPRSRCCRRSRRPRPWAARAEAVGVLPRPLRGSSWGKEPEGPSRD